MSLVERLAVNLPMTATSGYGNDLNCVSPGRGQYADGYRLTPHAVKRILRAIAEELEGPRLFPIPREDECHSRQAGWVDAAHWLREEAGE